jgi:hypothetical protein
VCDVAPRLLERRLEVDVLAAAEVHRVSKQIADTRRLIIWV